MLTSPRVPSVDHSMPHAAVCYSSTVSKSAVQLEVGPQLVISLISARFLLLPITLSGFAVIIYACHLEYYII